MKPLFNIRKTRSWEEVDYLNKTKWTRIQFFSENLFYIKFSLALSWLWLALAGSGWLWVILGWLLPALGDFGWLWLALTGSGIIHRLVIPACIVYLGEQSKENITQLICQLVCANVLLDVMDLHVHINLSYGQRILQTLSTSFPLLVKMNAKDLLVLP